MCELACATTGLILGPVKMENAATVHHSGPPAADEDGALALIGGEPEELRVGPDHHEYDYQLLEVRHGGYPVYRCRRNVDGGRAGCVLFLVREPNGWYAVQDLIFSPEPWLTGTPVFYSAEDVLVPEMHAWRMCESGVLGSANLWFMTTHG